MDQDSVFPLNTDFHSTELTNFNNDKWVAFGALVFSSEYHYRFMHIYLISAFQSIAVIFLLMAKLATISQWAAALLSSITRWSHLSLSFATLYLEPAISPWITGSFLEETIFRDHSLGVSTTNWHLPKALPTTEKQWCLPSAPTETEPCWLSIAPEGMHGWVRHSVLQGIWWDRSLDRCF